MMEKEIRKFRRASAQRLTTAELLLKMGLHLDAIYLAGYVVEGASKALILARSPQQERAPMLARIAAGQRGHDFEFLKGILKERGCIMPAEAASMLRRFATWSTDLRYEVGLVERKEAEEFLFAAQGLRDWVEKNL